MTSMTTPSLIDAARAWIIETYPYNRTHLFAALDWLDRVSPNASEAVRLATLTHDMERAFPGPDQPLNTNLIDPAYEHAHALRSARIVGQWLHAHHADVLLIDEVERLITAHEVGGWPDADLVQAADSLAFLDTNVDLFLDFVRSGRFSAADVGRKFDRSRDRIRIPHLKALAEPMVAAAHARLTALLAERAAAGAQASGSLA